MIPPFPTDLEIRFGPALPAKPAAKQQPPRRLVFRHAGGFNTVDLEFVERMPDGGLDRIAHVSLPRMGLTDPIAERSGACRPTAPILDREPAQQRVVGNTKDQIRPGSPVFRRQASQANPAPECRAFKMVVPPTRLPGLQECAALPP